MVDMDEHVIFYENKNRPGGAAVSLDGGVTVIVATGRSLNLAGVPMWEEADQEDIEPLLSEPQAAALKAHRERPEPTVLEKMAEDLKRRTALRERNGYRKPNPMTYKGQVRPGSLVVMSEDD